MKPSELKSGYLLEYKHTDGDTGYATICNTLTYGRTEELAVVSKKHWFPLSELNGNLSYLGFEVTKVYGLCAPCFGLDNSPGDRDLLWERPAPEEVVLEMTVKEIETALGHKVKVVGKK